jgi:alpha-beta hydrolase superfamily lysophospholipase
MSDQPERTDSFTGDGGTTIFYRHRPADPERGRLVIAHGLGEHSGRYAHVIEKMVRMGISVWALDHRGHGRSGGKRGHIESFNQYLLDLKQMIGIAKNKAPEKMKCLLLGHSMGGLMALAFAEEPAGLIDGVVASSPGLAPAIKVPVIKGFMGKLMSGVWPGLTFDNELDSSHLSHDRSVVQAYDSDPLVHRRVSARWFTEYMTTGDRTLHHGSKITIPILMQVAGDDRLVDAKASKTFFETLTADDKTLHVYDGLYHEIYNERDEGRQRVLSDLEHWLNDHL